MHFPARTSPTGACPASAVVTAVRAAATPLAIVTPQASGSTILFANDAFAELLQCDAGRLVGQALASIFARADLPQALSDAACTTLLDVATGDGAPFRAALSTAPVAGPDGAVLCRLCSLADARGDGAEQAIARDAGLLGEVALAASDLLRAADSVAPQPALAAEIALDAVERAAAPDPAGRA